MRAVSLEALKQELAAGLREVRDESQSITVTFSVQRAQAIVDELTPTELRHEPENCVLRVTPSQLMALKDLLLDYVLAKRIEVFVDVVRQVETTPAELLALVAQLEA